MKEQMIGVGIRHVSEVQQINRDLIEKALHMRCLAYLSHTKSELLTATIFEMGNSKHAVEKSLEDVSAKNKLVQNQKNELDYKNRQLKKVKNELELRIKELLITREQLIESEKMAGLGQMVTGIAHEINTPLSIGITGCTQLSLPIDSLKDLYTQDKVSKKEFENFLREVSEIGRLVNENLSKVADLVVRFKEVAVDQTSDRKRKFFIKHYLEVICDSLATQQETPPKISIDCANNLETRNYPGALIQIVSNLISNSMTHGFTDGENGEIVIKVEADDQNLRIIYSDNGCGIIGKNIKKVFDPFFTTTRGKGGIGLGLYITYNLITQKMKEPHFI